MVTILCALLLTKLLQHCNQQHMLMTLYSLLAGDGELVYKERYLLPIICSIIQQLL